MADDRCPDGVWATAALETLRIGSTEFLKAIESKDVEAAKRDFSQIEKKLVLLAMKPTRKRKNNTFVA